jgi:enamine deaminase RidA (YjgF/YER057c/UK114 family)
VSDHDEPVPGRHPSLSTPPPPQGNYAPAVAAGGLAVSAGMTPRRNGELVTRGRVGEAVTLSVARAAAALAAENALAAIVGAAGSLDHVVGCLRMTVYVACTQDFTALSAVADGATEALHAHLGNAGRPARSAIGVQSLPEGAPVEVELMAAIRAS